jgi:outer membrane beta-barrel protein
MRSIVRVLVGATLLLMASTALAAPEGKTEETNEPKTSHQGDLRADLARFWGAKREVSVVQLRLYTKDGRFEVTPFTGVIPNDDFIVYYPSGLRVGYHLSESFTVELSGTFAPESASDLGAFLTETVQLKRADIQETFDSFYTANVMWAPAYGKISLLGTKLTHFETYVGVGIGLFSTKNVPEANPDGVEEMKPSGNTVLGFRWFISDRFNVRTEYRQHFFQKFGGGVSIPVEMSLGLGVTI